MARRTPTTRKQGWLTQLEEIKSAAAKTEVFAEIMDDEWAATLRGHIEAMPDDGPPWAPEDVKVLTLLSGFSNLSALPDLDARLTSFRDCGLNVQAVEDKLRQLRCLRFQPEFCNHAFEALTLGYFARHGALVDVEPDDISIDGVIELDGRRILVEVTYTSKEMLPKNWRFAYGFCAIKLILQVVRKVRKKAADDRQLAKADGDPTLLVLGLNFWSASEIDAQSALRACFGDPRFKKLSGVVLNRGWRLRQTLFFANSGAEIPLTATEQKLLRSWFDRPPARPGRWR